MNFSWFSSKNKDKQEQLDKIKVYDKDVKQVIKTIKIDKNLQCSELLKVFNDDSQQVKMILIAVGTKENMYFFRRLQGWEKVEEQLHHKDPNLIQYLVYMDVPYSEILSRNIYHRELSKPNLPNNDEDFLRCGMLKKKSKAGQFREKQFKLLKDCLVFTSNEKKKNKKSFIQLDCMKVDGKKNNLIIELNVEQQKTYVLQAKSATDFEGWLYALNVQSHKAKEMNLINSYDRRISQYQKMKIETYKTIASQTDVLKQIIKTPLFEYFADWIIQQNDPLEIKLIELIRFALRQDENDSKKYKGQSFDLDTDQRERIIQDLINVAQNNVDFVVTNKDLAYLRSQSLQYLEKSKFQQYKKIKRDTDLLDYQKNKYAKFFQFSFKSIQDFWQDIQT